jgi:thymidylate synthase ThyX
MVENKFKEVDSIQLYNDYIGYVKLYDASHANESEEQRKYTVANIGALAYGLDVVDNPTALYERLKVLHHESLWEFIVDTYPATGIANSMRNIPLDYDGRYSNRQNIVEHKENIACFRVKVPIFVARQFMQHRSFSYFEMSRGYTNAPFEFWFPEDFPTTYKNLKVRDYLMDYELLCSEGYDTQVASRFLPQTTYTEFYCMADIDGLSNFMRLRLDYSAETPIRECAEAMLELLIQHQPELAKKVIP